MPKRSGHKYAHYNEARDRREAARATVATRIGDDVREELEALRRRVEALETSSVITLAPLATAAERAETFSTALGEGRKRFGGG